MGSDNIKDPTAAEVPPAITVTGVAMVAVSRSGVITTWNAAAERLFGYDAQQAINQSVTLILRHHEIPDQQVLLQRVLNGDAITFEFTYATETVAAVRIEMTAAPNVDPHQGVCGVILVARNITARQLKSLELHQNALRYRLALQTGGLAAWEVDHVTDKRSWTPEALSLFGFEKDGGRIPANSEEFRTWIHPEDRHILAEVHTSLLHSDTAEAEYRIVRRDGEVRWMSGHGTILERDAKGRPLRGLHVAADVTDRKHAEERAQILLYEIAHRSKNLLSIVQAIAVQIARYKPDDFLSQFSSRLAALAANQDLLIKGKWRGIDLADLVREQLKPFQDMLDGRISLSGPPLFVSTKAAQPLGMALHELATNASKYGAWSNITGKVAITWTVEAGEHQDEKPTVFISWIEHGGPAPLLSPPRRGFGSIILQDAVKHSLGAKVSVDLLPSGLRWTMTCSVLNITTKS